MSRRVLTGVTPAVFFMETEERVMKLVKWLDKHLEEILLVALLFVMMIIMGIQILARYALGNSLSWSEEITRFCFIWTGFLSISYCVKNSCI